MSKLRRAAGVQIAASCLCAKLSSCRHSVHADVQQGGTLWRAANNLHPAREPRSWRAAHAPHSNVSIS
jgi:hypothetical protein